MKKRPEVVAFILFVVLAAYAAAQHVFVIPVIQYMLASAGSAISIPGRLAISLSRFGSGPFLLVVAVGLLAIKRVWPATDRAQQARVLNLMSIVVVLFIVVEGSLYVDLARSASRVMRAGTQTASVNGP